VRVFVETMAAKDTRAYSVIEAAVSQPRADLFRGLFLVPKVLIGPLGLAIDRVDTRGIRGAESADQFAGWVKWAFIRKGHGVQLEYRRVNTDRDPDVPWSGKHTRTDVIARARARPLPGLVAELFGGRSKQTIDFEADSIKGEDESTQWGGAVSYTSPLVWARGSYRFRDAEALPSTQLDAAAGVQFKLGSVAGQVTQSDWRDSGSASEYTVRGEIGPPAFRVFGETTSSDRGVPYLPVDTVAGADSSAIITSYEGYRVGAQANYRGISVGAAYVHAKADSVTTFGLPFDRTRQLFPGGDASGWELSGRVPVPLIKGLFVEGMINDWRSGNVWLYTPTRNYRVGLELYTTPLKSGNLEVLGRIETIHRSIMVAPDLSAEAQAPTLTQPAVDYFDAYLEIRIIDVRAFMRYEDLSGQRVADIPGRQLPGPRIIYGVKWQFFN
jgi:hypothetical protein